MHVSVRYMALAAFLVTSLLSSFRGAARYSPSPAADGRRNPLPPGTVRPPADHHVHIWSAAARDLLLRGQEALGQEVISERQARVLTGDDVIADLDSAGIEKGVVLSTAYFFGIPDLEVEDELALVRAENDYVARQVEAHPERLVGFLSVNPLAEYAIQEIYRLAGRDAFVGLKLHLGNSNVSLRDSADLARLREVVARANDEGLAILVHLGGRSEAFGAPDARAFLKEILPAAPDVPVQIAHMGGPGGFGSGTRASLRTFAEALDERPELTSDLVFDLSGVPHPASLARGDTALLERIEEVNAGFLDAARRIGFDRIVYGSDFPAISTSTYLEGLRATLPLSAEELGDLLDDRAPYLR